ncbi:uncharacterized protein LOC126213179 [Schistocerca nitens]|uniref:uncharacterized protein LOC126213179 n=1 Tax=Schistocerca nitens TaxID=7011 RepID=UPI0021180E00|nr:uncharacterized protein LOC126213179 [Schistocerca nitens]
MIAMHFVTDEKRLTVKFEQSLYCRTEAMDQEPTMWIKKEEMDEVQTEICFMFFVDPLKTEGPGVWVKQDPELELHTDGSEHYVSFHTSTVLCRKCSKNVMTQIRDIQLNYHGRLTVETYDTSYFQELFGLLVDSS